MESHKYVIGVLLMLTWAVSVSSITDCPTVTALISSCSTFITYGSPDPFPGSPCCDAITTLNLIADAPDNRPSVCRCLMGLITTYNPNATAIATLPGFCGIHLGFTIGPNTDCN
ncbi:hypothetical protein Pint_17399 [Pistacia integerrima]|uniref:Uncharacterized protein n=1 Tax=Pistacia integerrima TaxID=434235 RepID=A0ACC0YZA7_9ROSI|nr:hypothetical protein Pint_17399 [Pistacia integerrima]